MRRFIFIVFVMMSTAGFPAFADTVKGVVVEKNGGAPMAGASIIVKGTTNGTTAGQDGKFELEIGDAASVDLEISFLFYKTVTVEDIIPGSDLRIEMEPEEEMLEGSVVVGTKTLDNERALLMERHNSSVSIENIGAKEMGVKGISNVQEGVKKLSGVSIASSGQLIVRGLGDRYSTTTLNGMPIASPNPDNKLIPLDIFPASTIQNITVSKVFLSSIAGVLFFYLYRRQRKQNKELVLRYQDYLKRDEMLRKYMEQSRQKGNGSAEEDLFGKLEKLMREEKIYLSNEISLDKLASILGTNRTYISRVINRYADKSFWGYVNMYRISDATKMLSDLDNDIQIKNMYEKLGYNSATSFFRVFRDEVGLSPSKYREEIRRMKPKVAL